MSGKLFLIPVPLGEETLFAIPEYVIQQIHALEFFIVERAKTARRFIKSTSPPYSISELTIFELDKHHPEKGLVDFLKPALDGHHIGLMSEAGCPGIADPGAKVVSLAHQKGIKVLPMVGPSSILLALMGSGLNGQNFSFQGYLSVKKPELAKDLKRLEGLAYKLGQTQIFIETPYRNLNLVQQAIKVLDDRTLFCIAMDINLPSQYVKTASIKEWKKIDIPDLHKRPSVFLIGRK